MKKILFPLLALAIFVSCDNETPLAKTLTQVITLPNSDEITVPVGYSLVEQQGIDSSVGIIVSDSNPDFELLYDIGLLASEYVDSASATAVDETSVNEDFRYDIVDKEFLSDPDCCVFVTFPETGPTNFITLNNDDWPLILEIMKSYERID